MKLLSFVTSASAVLSSSFVVATPVKRDDSTPTTTQILQFALTLEHLESTFYAQGLSQFSEQDFCDAGFEPWVYGRFKQIGEHEASHVELLTSALGSDAVAACEYSFPYTDPTSFATLAFLLETVGDSAYTGAARYIADGSTLQIAASILSVEARHSAWIKSAALHSYPWSSPYDTALDGDLVYTLASSFITSCPSTNPTLPFTAFPALTATPTSGGSELEAGGTVSLSYNSSDSTDTSGSYYLALFHGLETTFVNITDNQATIPSDILGIAYAVVTDNNTAFSDSSVIAGPAILSIPFDADASD